MQISKLKTGVLNSVLVGLLTTSSVVFGFDLNATYKEVNFAVVDVPACGNEADFTPALPKDKRANFYYQVAQKILGQNDVGHYEQMYILGDKAAEMGDWRAKLLMANLYLKNANAKSQYTNYNPKKAKAYIDDLIKQNVPAAFYAMAQYKLNGMEEFRNEPVPVSVLLFEAAKLSNPDALSDMYNIYISFGRFKEGEKLLDCAVKQKYGVASALLKKANALEVNANTEQELVESFKYLYKAAKAGSYEAIASFPNKEAYYRQQFGKAFFGQDFLGRMEYFQMVKSSLYFHRDPYRKSLGVDDKIKGNMYLAFPHLEKVLPFPPATLPSWNRDVSVTLSPDTVEAYQTDFDYNKLVKEATAINVDKTVSDVAEQKK